MIRPQTSASGVVVRDATTGDVDAIRGIFNLTIPTTTAIRRDRLASETEMAGRFTDHQVAGIPVLVADFGEEGRCIVQQHGGIERERSMGHVDEA